MDNTTYSAVLGIVADAMKAKLQAAEGIRKILDLFMNLRPHPVWEEIGACDFCRDVKNLKIWLEGLMTRHPPGGKIEALCFGLFEGTVDYADGNEEENNVGTILYVCGSDHYSRNDTDWACGPAYFPKGRYANSSVLRCVYQKTSGLGESLSTLGTDCLCLAFAALSVAEVLRETDPKVLLGRKKERFVGTGHDSGEIYTIGKITKRGFLPTGPHSPI